MSWIEEHLRQNSQKPPSDRVSPEADFAAAARRRWQELGRELQADAAEFDAHQPGVNFARDGDDAFRVTNANSGIELTLVADFDSRTVRYTYSGLDHGGGGVPEGGMLSMRQARNGQVEFYSADERLTCEETRQVLLEPMLFPRLRAG
jgi:hypothetical protein